MRITSLEAFQTQGPRGDMQDVAVYRQAADRPAYLGVFDGHRSDGYEVARAASRVVAMAASRPLEAGADLQDEAAWIKHGLGRISLGVKNCFPDGGSTATVVAVRGPAIAAIYLGDSEAYFYPYQADAIALTEPHTVENEREVERVQAAGGRVQRLTRYFYADQLRGQIQTSRAVGDYDLPFVSHEAEQTCQVVTQPGVLVVATDGVWGDQHDEVEKAVRRNSFNQKFIEQCARETGDNAAAVIARLDLPRA